MTDHFADGRPRHGAIVVPGGLTRFAVWAPSVDAVSLEIKGETPLPMAPSAGGWFLLEADAPAGTRYKFRLPDGLAVPDPASRAQDGDVHGYSIVTDHSDYRWRHETWHNRPFHEAVIYEVHAGLLGGFSAMRKRLAAWAGLGITAIELMPIADFPGCRNWGYDGVLPYAPDASYGTPDELKALIDEAHGHGLMMFLDVVYNHFGPDGAYIHSLAKPFFDEHVHTPWGAAIDFSRPEVVSFFLDNALMWLRDYRFDGLRFDAVHAISPQGALPELAAGIRAGAAHPVHLVLEHEGNRASLLRAGPDAPGYDAQWADDFHHCVHVLLTGERDGYYAGFPEPAKQLARCLAEGFAYQGETPPGQDAPRGEASAHLPPQDFVFCLQNHDQIGNRAMGERLSVLTRPELLDAAATLLLLSPFIPLLFMGEEWGALSPFLYFTDHNADLADAVREGRRREFAHFPAFRDEARRAAIPDPNAEASFAASRLDEAACEREPHARAHALYTRLLALRAAHVTPGIPGCKSLGSRALTDRAVFARWALGNGDNLSMAANFGDAPVAVDPVPGTLLFASVGAPSGGLVPPCSTCVWLEAQR